MHAPGLRIHWSRVMTKSARFAAGAFEFNSATNLPYGSFVVVVVVCSFL